MGHSHNHSHQVKNYNKIFAIGVGLNVLFVIVEVFYGLASDSLALIADAGHNLSDVLGLLLAWGAYYMSLKPATDRKTYGYRKMTIMAALASSILLLVALGGITWEAIGRFMNPEPIKGKTVIIVALVGVFVNGLTAFLLFADQKHDLNIKGAFLHMAADAGISLGVVIAGLIMLKTNIYIIDPIVCFLIVLIILIGTWSLFKESFYLSIDSVPKEFDMEGLKKYINSLENVVSYHDLHIWSLSTTEIALTVHIVVNNNSFDNNFILSIQKDLHDLFHIEHPTVQIEFQCEENKCQMECK